MRVCRAARISTTGWRTSKIQVDSRDDASEEFYRIHDDSQDLDLANNVFDLLFIMYGCFIVFTSLLIWLYYNFDHAIFAEQPVTFWLVVLYVLDQRLAVAGQGEPESPIRNEPSLISMVVEARSALVSHLGPERVTLPGCCAARRSLRRGAQLIRGRYEPCRWDGPGSAKQR